mgnify:FL=1
MKKVEEFILANPVKSNRVQKRNLRFHIALMTVMKVVNKDDYKILDLYNLDINSFNKEVVDDASNTTLKMANQLIKKNKSTLDKIVKSRELTNYLGKNFKAQFLKFKSQHRA